MQFIKIFCNDEKLVLCGSPSPDPSSSSSPSSSSLPPSSLSLPNAWRVLSFDRLGDPTVLSIHDDQGWMSRDACNNHLSSLDASSTTRDGLTLLGNAYALLGAIRFLRGYYLVLVTERRVVGKLHDSIMYEVTRTRLLPISLPEAYRGYTKHDHALLAAEQRYTHLFVQGLDLSHDFFYSDGYPLCHSRQQSSRLNKEEDDDGLVWNAHLCAPFASSSPSSSIIKAWIVPLMHGSLHQRTVAVSRRLVTMTLIARRSRHYAGTRFLKRGCDVNGHVANFVETEQIVDMERNETSFVQVRGSVPLVWHQDDPLSTLNPRPDITISTHDVTFERTLLHLQSLEAAYGSPIILLNLLKKSTVEAKGAPREVGLGAAFEKSITTLLQDHLASRPLLYHAFDFSGTVKQDRKSVLPYLILFGKRAVDKTNVYVRRRHAAAPSQLQEGVVRTNCLDCIDRTNVAQFAIGVAALQCQLTHLGLLSPRSDCDGDGDGDGCMLDCGTSDSIAFHLLDMYQKQGDAIARQYGGSDAHQSAMRDEGRATEEEASTFALWTNLRRFYSNTVIDRWRQDAMNLFLGLFVPPPLDSGQAQLWELSNDWYLHQTRRACPFSSPSRHAPCEAEAEAEAEAEPRDCLMPPFWEDLQHVAPTLATHPAPAVRLLLWTPQPRLVPDLDWDQPQDPPPPTPSLPQQEEEVVVQEPIDASWLTDETLIAQYTSFIHHVDTTSGLDAPPPLPLPLVDPLALPPLESFTHLIV